MTSVCSFVYKQDYAKSPGQNPVEPGGRMCFGSGRNSYEFGTDPDQEVDPGSFLPLNLTL